MAKYDIDGDGTIDESELEALQQHLQQVSRDVSSGGAVRGCGVEALSHRCMWRNLNWNQKWGWREQ